MSFESIQNEIDFANKQIQDHIDAANVLEQSVSKLQDELLKYCDHKNSKKVALNTGSWLDVCEQCKHKYMYSLVLNNGWMPYQTRGWNVWDPNK